MQNVHWFYFLSCNKVQSSFEIAGWSRRWSLWFVCMDWERFMSKETSHEIIKKYRFAVGGVWAREGARGESRVVRWLWLKNWKFWFVLVEKITPLSVSATISSRSSLPDQNLAVINTPEVHAKAGRLLVFNFPLEPFRTKLKVDIGMFWRSCRCKRTWKHRETSNHSPHQRV